jgi:hypothetical protein
VSADKNRASILTLRQAHHEAKLLLLNLAADLLRAAGLPEE